MGDAGSKVHSQETHAKGLALCLAFVGSSPPCAQGDMVALDLRHTEVSLPYCWTQSSPGVWLLLHR